MRGGSLKAWNRVEQLFSVRHWKLLRSGKRHGMVYTSSFFGVRGGGEGVLWVLNLEVYIMNCFSTQEALGSI